MRWLSHSAQAQEHEPEAAPSYSASIRCMYPRVLWYARIRSHRGKQYVSRAYVTERVCLSSAVLTAEGPRP